MVIRNATRTNRPISCPGCGNTRTNRVGNPIRQRPPETPVEMPPSEAQMKYIQALNGDCRKARTKKEAGEYITRLKKLKEG